MSTQAGFSYLDKVAYGNQLPREKSVNTFIRTNPVPAINRYRHDQYDNVKRPSSSFYVTPKETIGKDFDLIVLPSSKSITNVSLEREITRGTQKGYKTCIYGPHRPLNTEIAPNAGKDISPFKEPGQSVEFTKLDPRLYNIAGATHRGGFKIVADNLGRDLNGRDKTSLTGYGAYLPTSSFYTGGNKGGHIAGEYEQRIKTGNL